MTAENPLVSCQLEERLRFESMLTDLSSRFVNLEPAGVDREAKRLSTTSASGLNRETPIEHLSSSDGTIFFHGFEMGRAFSVCLEATSYMVKN
jgi:hypothetical protein